MSVAVKTSKEIKQMAWKVIAKHKLNYDADLCPCFKKGKMVAIFHFKANAPPDTALLQALKEMIKKRTA